MELSNSVAAESSRTTSPSMACARRAASGSMPSSATSAEVSITKGSVRQTVAVVAEYLLGRTVVLHWQPGAAVTDSEKFVRQFEAAPAPHTLQALAQRLHDGGSEGFARGFGDFAGQAVRFGILDAEWHIYTCMYVYTLVYSPSAGQPQIFDENGGIASAGPGRPARRRCLGPFSHFILGPGIQARQIPAALLSQHRLEIRHLV